MSPLLAPETTLKDALSMMLDADVQAGIVVDRDGRAVGLVTTDMIGDLPARQHAAARPADGGRRGRVVIDWGWIGDHLGAIADRTIQHLELAAIAVVRRLR